MNQNEVARAPSELGALTPEHEDAVAILRAIWRAIDFATMPPSRRMGIYDEFASRVRSAAMCRDDQGLGGFLQRVCDRLGITQLNLHEPPLVHLVADPRVPEFLRLFREETLYLMALLRAAQDQQRRST